MTRSVPEPPPGSGETVFDPPYQRWEDLARRGARAAGEWGFTVGGRPARSLRAAARELLVPEAHRWTEALGVNVSPPPQDPGFVIATGHQPEFYHAGVWSKVFLLQRIAGSLGAVALDVVVDSDTVGDLGVTVPRIDGAGALERETHLLMRGGAQTCYACAPPPDSDAVASFCEKVTAALGTLPAGSPAHNFATFAEALRASVPGADDAARFVTAARRRYEGPAADYLELPVTVAARSEPYLRLVADIALSAARFAEVHNEVLATHRAHHSIRSPAHPFPDLTIGPDEVELPFWLLDDGARSPVYARAGAREVEIVGPPGRVLALPDGDHDGAVSALATSGVLIVPRAITLTLFFRGFVADLFIHGTGGAGYDRVTEEVAREWWGIELPPAVAATLTMHLPLGMPVVTDEDVSSVDQRLHRLAHNPDELIDEVQFGSEEERRRAVELAAEKRALVEAISTEGADRKALGLAIRAVNAELAGLLEPVASELRRERDRLAARRAASGIIADRTYPFCLFEPDEIRDAIG